MDLIEQLLQSRLVTWQIKNFLWQQNFLTPKYWFIVVTIALSYAIWWKFLDKKRIFEIMLFGSFIAVTRVIFDDWGITSGRWTYIFDLVPLGLSLFLNDLTIVPLGYMLAYQYSPSWSRYFITIVILQSAISFAFLPLLKWMGILVLHNWSVTYTFAFMMVTAIIMRAIMMLGAKVQKSAKLEYTQGTSFETIPQPAMKPIEKDNDKE